MFNKFNDKIEENEPNKEELEELIIKVFFEGDKEKAIKKFQELRDEAASEEEFNLLINREFNFEFFEELLKRLVKVSNFKEIIIFQSELYDLNKYITNEENLFNFLENSDRLFKEDLNFCKNVFGNMFKIEENDFNKETLSRKYLYTSKQQIADEFEIDKKTLNKWLKHFFGNRFDGRKRISFLEYREIFDAFFLDENSENYGDIDFQKLRRRISKGMKFWKSDIANSIESDLKTQKNEFKEFGLYNEMDVFPYSLMKKIVEKLLGEINF